MRPNLILANLQPNNALDFRALDFYKLLRGFSKSPTTIFKPSNYNLPIQTLHNLVGEVCRFTIENINNIRNTNIFVFSPDLDTLNLHQSNKIFLVIPEAIKDNQLLLLPTIDTILTHSVYEAGIIGRQLRKLGYATPIAKLIPPINVKPYAAMPEIFKLGFQQGLKSDILNNLRHIPIISIDKAASLNQISAYLHINTSIWPYDAIEAMTYGKPVITVSRPPLLEYIFNDYNGIFFRTKEEAIEAIRKISDAKFRQSLSTHAYEFITNLLNPTSYIAELNNIINDQFFNLNTTISEPTLDKNSRKWLFRKQTLDQGKITYSPVNYDPSFSVSNLTGLIDILEFLLKQSFNSAYIFDFEFDDQDVSEFNKLMTIFERLNKRGLQIHFCTDEQILYNWRDTFKYLSVISVDEGNRQVS